jgi:hypothetical protein
MNDALSVHSRRRAMATALAPPDWAAIHRELKRKHVTCDLWPICHSKPYGGSTHESGPAGAPNIPRRRATATRSIESAVIGRGSAKVRPPAFDKIVEEVRMCRCRGRDSHGRVAGRSAGAAVRDSGGRLPHAPSRPTDVQARVMKMADGGFRPAYNVQFAGGPWRRPSRQGSHPSRTQTQARHAVAPCDLLPVCHSKP